MKALFLISSPLTTEKGITKKIIFQRKALAGIGVESKVGYLKPVSLENTSGIIEPDFAFKPYKGFAHKLRTLLSENELADYIKQNRIDMVYVRHEYNSGPGLINRLKKLRRAGIKIVLEIPTYPYDKEFKKASPGHKLNLAVDKMFRERLSRQVDKIVTFTDYEKIFGCPTIRISNGIDFKSVPLKRRLDRSEGRLDLISVSEIRYWHGLDRVINGLADYFADRERMTRQGKEEIHDAYPDIRFHVAGGGFGKEFDALRRLVRKKGLDAKVVFYGNTSGDTLDRLFEKADFGIASLGRHRSGITRIKTLKNREYAARGLPFVYSETDDDFEEMPYIIKAPANDSPLDIKRIVDFYRQLEMTPQQIRSTIEDSLSWEVQMKKVVDGIF